MSDVTTPATGINVAEYLQKLVKLIPGEIVTLYAALVAFVPKEAPALFVAAGICLALVPVFLAAVLKVKNVAQIVVMTIGFAVYVFAAPGSPFGLLGWYQSWMAGFALVIYTAIPPMILGTTPAPVAAPGTTASVTKSWRQV